MPKVSMKFFQNPMNWAASSFSSVMVALPVEKPVPTGCSTQMTFVRVCQLQGFLTGLKVPYCQRKGPFS